jgi:hypothetical protein
MVEPDSPAITESDDPGWAVALRIASESTESSTPKSREPERDAHDRVQHLWRETRADHPQQFDLGDAAGADRRSARTEA